MANNCVGKSTENKHKLAKAAITYSTIMHSCIASNHSFLRWLVWASIGTFSEQVLEPLVTAKTIRSRALELNTKSQIIL